jgi:hypothetical protein
MWIQPIPARLSGTSDILVRLIDGRACAHPVKMQASETLLYILIGYAFDIADYFRKESFPRVIFSQPVQENIGKGPAGIRTVVKIIALKIGAYRQTHVIDETRSAKAVINGISPIVLVYAIIIFLSVVVADPEVERKAPRQFA